MKNSVLEKLDSKKKDICMKISELKKLKSKGDPNGDIFLQLADCGSRLRQH